MLELVEPFVELSRHIRTRQDALAALQRTCDAFAFRAAVMLEYSQDLRTIVDYLDTNKIRRPRWKSTPTAESMRRTGESSRALIDYGKVVRFDASRFKPDDPNRRTVENLDLLEGLSIPITYESGVAGAVHFSGLPALSQKQEDALHVIAYMLFANFRAVHGKEELTSSHSTLTPREKEVMVQSSLGYTSPEIAEMLGMAERTVNQHIENVAYKFGTKNRLHTVANLLRLNLLD